MGRQSNTGGRHLLLSVVLSACFWFGIPNVYSATLADIPIVKVDNVPVPYYSVPTVRALLNTYPIVIVHYTQVTGTEAARRDQDLKFRRTVQELNSKTILTLDPMSNLCSIYTALKHTQSDMPAYLLTDDRRLMNRVNAEGCWSARYVSDYHDLKRQLRELNREPRGLLINAIQSLHDPEYNITVSADRINQAFLRYDRHIDLSFVLLENNLSMIIVQGEDTRFLLNVRRLQKIAPDLSPYFELAVGIIQGTRT